MRIINVGPEHEELFFCCLEDWSNEAAGAGTGRAEWYRKAQGEGLRAKLVLDDAGTVGGMIQYGPIESSFAEGEGLFFIYCIWVHGYKKGRGNFQKRGMGTALLAAAEEDARALGATGMAAWGLKLPFWMKAAWFRRHGYAPADTLGMARLVWKPFTPEALPPRWMRPLKTPTPVTGKVSVVSLSWGWCMAQNLAHERARQAAAEFGEAVQYTRLDTSDPAVRAEWGRVDDLFIDGCAVRLGPPPSLEKLRKKIARRVRRLTPA